MRLYGPISALTNINVEFISSIVSFERVFEYLDLPVEIEDEPGAIAMGTTQGHVRFEQVSFSYYSEGESASKGDQVNQIDPVDGKNGKEDYSEISSNGTAADEVSGSELDRRWAIQDASFEIKPGELVALVGRSGAGKTTITYLLPRLYEPTGGRITLDGHDLREISLESLARQIGMVTQETYLFHDTIRNNLLYAKPDASLEEIESACRAANIHEFISSLPEGYDTLVGERGYRLSGGEKQRLAIARVILKNPRLLILDEATSHLDSQNEALIQAALAPLFRGRSSLVIAHRLSTILAADKILVLEKGHLVEQGTHHELLRLGGLYARLYETQFGKEEAQ
jgi:ATP-binding cassette subfamily B protein